MLRKPDSYAALLRVRQRQEDMRAQALAAARRTLMTAQAQRDAIAEEQRRALEGARAAAEQRFDAEDVRRYYQYERHLARLRDEKDAELHTLRRRVAERRADLEESRKSRRKAEKLDEWQREAYREAQRKLEQKAMDESAVIRFAYSERGSAEVSGERPQ